MAIAKTLKSTAATAKVPPQTKQIDISDRALIGIIFSVVMGFVAIVFFQLKSDINQTRTELKADINQTRTELKADINKLEVRIDKIDSKLDQILLHLVKRR